jgi:hypothetical protein
MVAAMKADEIALLQLAAAVHEGPYKCNKEAPFIDALGALLGMHTKRSHYLAGKWCDKGWWDFGTTLRSGWFSPEGWEVANKLLGSLLWDE